MDEQNAILLVEDDPFDAGTIRHVLRDLKMTNPVVHVEDGEDALAFLQNSDTDRPCVILLDLRMKRMDGFQFMQAVWSIAGLHDIPIVVVSTSDEPAERDYCYRLGAVGYVVKCADYDEFKLRIESYQSYWQLVESMGLN